MIVPAAALKLAEVAPEGTVTEAGTVRTELLSDKVTATPPDGAAPPNVTVHVELASEAIEVGVQVRLVSGGGNDPVTATLPPVPVIVNALPSGRGRNQSGQR